MTPHVFWESMFGGLFASVPSSRIGLPTTVQPNVTMASTAAPTTKTTRSSSVVPSPKPRASPTVAIIGVGSSKVGMKKTENEAYNPQKRPLHVKKKTAFCKRLCDFELK